MFTARMLDMPHAAVLDRVQRGRFRPTARFTSEVELPETPSDRRCIVCLRSEVHARRRCFTCYQYLRTHGYDRSWAMVDRQRERDEMKSAVLSSR